MDSDHPGWQFLFLILLIIANGIFSATELAVVSAKKPRLEQWAKRGNKGARAALKIAADPNELFSTIQIGITAIGIITGMLGASTLAEPLAAALAQIPVLSPYADMLSLFIIMAGVTYLTLIIGELVPKRIAVNSPETIAAWVARPMFLFARINAPFIYLLTLSTNAVLRILGVRLVDEPPATEDEIRFLLQQGAQMGAFDREEPELIERIFRLNDIPAEYIMTARPQMIWLDLEDTEEMIGRTVLSCPYTRLPVGMGSLDDCRGIIYVKDLLAARLLHPSDSWKKLIAKLLVRPLYIPETLTLNKILDMFREHNAHEAIILDEYGAPEGIITLHDILEEILGAMPGSVQERIEERNRILPRGAQSWLIDGLLGIEEFRDFFDLKEPFPKEGEDYYKTLGGFVIFLFGYLPKETEKIRYNDFIFEIIDNDNYRIDKVLVTRTPPENTADVALPEQKNP